MMSKEQFVKYLNEESQDKCLEIQDIVRVNDNEAQAIIRGISKCNNVAQFQALPRDTRNTFLSELKGKGLSVRQIGRLIGMRPLDIRRIDQCFRVGLYNVRQWTSYHHCSNERFSLL